MDLPRTMKALLQQHPAVQRVALIGSRQQGEPTPLSDWDFEVEVDDFEAFKADLPDLVEELEPLGKQWDRLSSRWNYMLFLSGPVKVDIIVDRPHEKAGPWTVSTESLPQIEHHFWDWILWIGGKQLHGKVEVVEQELEKMVDYLLRPLGIEERPRGVAEAIDVYRRARKRAEERMAVRLDRRMENEVVRILKETRVTA